MNTKQLHPFGIQLTINNLSQISVNELRRLVDTHKIILIKNCNMLSKLDFEYEFAKWGPLLEWEFGRVYG